MRLKRGYLVFGVFVLLIYFVMAAPTLVTLNTPVAGTNTSDNTPEFNFTVVGSNSSYAIELFIGGVGYGNSSALNNTLTSITANASLTDGTYEWNITATNDTALTSTGQNITIDNTPPNVSTFYATINNGSYSGTIVLNVSVSDTTMGVDSVYFNITNSSGDQLNFTKASNSSVYYNITLNTTGFIGGKYNITVHANDTLLNNLNNSEKIQITIDNTVPVVELSSSSSSTTSVTVTVTVTDALSGAGSCTANRSVTFSGSGGNQSFTESSLNCDTSYYYLVTCTDLAGNSGISSTTTGFSTDNCGSVGSPSTPTSFWTKGTFIVSAENFEEGYTKEVSAKQRLKIMVGSETHYIGVIEVTSATAVINISSETQQATLTMGDLRRFEVTGDNYYDLSVVLDSLDSSKANLTIKSISEEITPETIAEEEDKEKKDATSEEDDEAPPVAGENDLTWLWIILVGVIAAVIVGVVLYIQNKRNN